MTTHTVESLMALARDHRNATEQIEATGKALRAALAALDAQPAVEPQQRVCELLASCWYYGDWRGAQPGYEQEIETLMRRLGLWPTTEEAIIARYERAQPAAEPAKGKP